MSSRVPGDFPERIRRIRIKFELTQSRMAGMMGVSFATVNRWENGQSRPSNLAWQKILRAEKYGIEALDIEFDPSAFLLENPVPYRPLSETDFSPDFTTDPAIVQTVAEGYRLGFGHLFNPVFATETSRIDPLPHQRIAVYENMLAQPRLRFLLADDAGAGKTIMAGLYIREMLARRLLSRVLIVSPAGLLGNWEREMRELFSLPFRIVSGQDARSGNPFKDAESNLLIASLDTLAGETMFSKFQESGVVPYELVIIDEAHKLSARLDPDGTFRATDRYRLGEALAGIRNDDKRWRIEWRPRHILLLTATPHMGKDFPYFCLWRLLEPEALSTYSAFAAYPQEVRHRHFLRRAKEEMVGYDGSRIYPARISNTLTYDLSQGEISEQALYDATTSYIKVYYNKARNMNRAAACFAMSIFQRRLASSTYALMRSFERRIEKLGKIMDDIRAGKIPARSLESLPSRLDDLQNVLFRKTADEETAEDGQEEFERAEQNALEGTAAQDLADLEAEREKVAEVLALTKKVCEIGEESKFEKLREILYDSKFQNEKIIIFTEHRDTLIFLLRRLEGIGYGDCIAQIHGGMNFVERDEQKDFFQKANEEGGARFLVATDAAGEGINLQFCRLMVNYDIPWNPARLEQRMGRIHRYGQSHDVVIMNLVAGKTREGRVLRTLLDKLEKIRKKLGSDKVFDVIGRIFEDLSLKDYMEWALSEDGMEKACKDIEGRLTESQVKAIKDREHATYGSGGDVARELPRLQRDLEQEIYRRLMPGFVHRFVENAAFMAGIKIDGDLSDVFSFEALRSGAMDPLWPVLERYPANIQNRLTIHNPKKRKDIIFLHPGEPLFDAFCNRICSKFGADALRGGIFVDASAQSPYFFHLLSIKIRRKADREMTRFATGEVLECRLLGLKQHQDGHVEECPAENLLLLKGKTGMPAHAVRFAAKIKAAREHAIAFAVDVFAKGIAEEHRNRLLRSLPEREELIRRGYDFEESELAERRIKFSEREKAGDPLARHELSSIKERQRQISSLRQQAIAALRREPDMIEPGEVEFLAHALVVPSDDPEDKKAQDKIIEEIAVKVVVSHEEADGARVKDVSTRELARMAGLPENPGFDLLSRRPDGEERSIEVKGRAATGEIEVSENEWGKACNLRERYWLYVVFDCASPHPRLLRIQNPFNKLLVKLKGGVKITAGEITANAEANR